MHLQYPLLISLCCSAAEKAPAAAPAQSSAGRGKGPRPAGGAPVEFEAAPERSNPNAGRGKGTHRHGAKNHNESDKAAEGAAPRKRQFDRRSGTGRYYYHY